MNIYIENKIVYIQNYMIKLHDPRPLLHIFNFIENFSSLCTTKRLFNSLFYGN